MTRIITDDEFIAAFDAAVEERGRDFVYPQEWKAPILDSDADPRNVVCLYNLEDDSPACVFGLAFHKLGLTPATGVITDILDMTAQDDLNYENDASEWRANADVQFDLTWETRSAASYAQVAQDDGRTWGMASDLFHSSLDGEAPGAD